MQRSSLPVLAVAVLGAGVCAQTTVSYISPFGCQSNDGNSGNTIPWWGGSATYQQVHDAGDLAWVFPLPVGIIRGISFRADNTYTLVGRTLDAQVTMGITPVTAASASTTFASNLGPQPMVTLPYTSVNLPPVSSVSVPNPQGWFIPFTVPFIYIPQNGNLCWELRTKNSTTNAVSYCDATSGSAPVAPSFGPLLGAGCTATGQTQPATIGLRSMVLASGSFVNRLDYARASSAAAMVIGATRQNLVLPGMCAGLETVPLVSVNGTTDATGTWNSSLLLGSLVSLPRATVYTQFAFGDAGLPYGFGLSPCSPVTLPGASTYGVTRIWAVASSSGQGNETATVGTTGVGYGLVVGFDF